jgi:hypothetical protein
VDENEVEAPVVKPAEEPVKKKGLFKKKESEAKGDIPATSGGKTEESGKKKKKEKKEKKPKETKPKEDGAPKEEDDDDGF